MTLSLPSQVRYFFREATRRIWISRRTSSVAILMIALALSIVGVFLIASENINRAMDEWEGHSRVVVYFQPDATQSSIDAVNAFLNSRPGFEKRTFINREQAVARFKQMFENLGSVVDTLGQNPFPPSIEIEVSRATVNARNFDDDITAMRRMGGVEDVQFDWEWLARLRKLVRTVNSVGLLIGATLALAAAFMIANVIRLTMFLYRDEIEIMRLVGATEGFVKGPFLLEGCLQGLVGAVLALGALYGAFTWGRYVLVQQHSAIAGVLVGRFLSWQEISILLAGGAAAGLFGSWLSLREAPPQPYA